MTKVPPFPDRTNYATRHLFSDKRSTWHVESGYTEQAEVKASYPRRAMGSGVTAGFTISLETRNRDLDYVCRGPVQGFKVQGHGLPAPYFETADNPAQRGHFSDTTFLNHDVPYPS
jgi:hypothetical protein